MADALNNNILILTDAVNRLSSQVSVIAGGGGGAGAATDSLSERAFFLSNSLDLAHRGFTVGMNKWQILQKANTKAIGVLGVVLFHTMSRWASLQQKAATLSLNTNKVQTDLIQSNYKDRLATFATQTELLRVRKGLGSSGKFSGELSDKMISLGENIGGLMAASVDLNTRYMLTGRQTEKLSHTMLIGAEDYNRSSEDMVGAMTDLGQEFANVAGLMGFGPAALQAQQELVAMFGPKGTPFINNFMQMLGSSEVANIARVQLLGLGKLQDSMLKGTITSEEIVAAVRANHDRLGSIDQGNRGGMIFLGAMNKVTGGQFTTLKQLNNLFKEPVKKWTTKTETDKAWQNTVRFQLEALVDPALDFFTEWGPTALDLFRSSRNTLQVIAGLFVAGNIFKLLGGGGLIKRLLLPILGANLGIAAGAKLGMTGAAMSADLARSLASKSSLAVAGGTASRIPAALTGSRLLSTIGPMMLMATRFIPGMLAVTAGIWAGRWAMEKLGIIGDKKDKDKVQLSCPELSHLATTNRELINARVSLMNRDVFTGINSTQVYGRDSLTALQNIAGNTQNLVVAQINSAATNIGNNPQGKTKGP